MALMVSRTDFEDVVQVSKHCEFDVLEEYILERQEMDMMGLLGNCFFTDVMENLNEASYGDLLDGSTFDVECGGSTKKLTHFGLKRVLIHYAYAAYVYRKNFVDTPFNVVIKQAQDSVPATPEQLFKLHNEHRRIAFKYWEMTLEYLCANKDDFPEFPEESCHDCEYYNCNDRHKHCKCKGKGCKKCKGGKSNNLRGNRITVIG